MCSLMPDSYRHPCSCTNTLYPLLDHREILHLDLALSSRYSFAPVGRPDYSCIHICTFFKTTQKTDKDNTTQGKNNRKISCKIVKGTIHQVDTNKKVISCGSLIKQFIANISVQLCSVVVYTFNWQAKDLQPQIPLGCLRKGIWCKKSTKKTCGAALCSFLLLRESSSATWWPKRKEIQL